MKEDLYLNLPDEADFDEVCDIMDVEYEGNFFDIDDIEYQAGINDDDDEDYDEENDPYVREIINLINECNAGFNII